MLRVSPVTGSSLAGAQRPRSRPVSAPWMQQIVATAGSSGNRRPLAGRSGNKGQSPPERASPGPAAGAGTTGTAQQKAADAPAAPAAPSPAASPPAVAAAKAAVPPKASAAAAAAPKAAVAVTDAPAAAKARARRGDGNSSAPVSPAADGRAPATRKRQKIDSQGEEDFDGLVHVDYSDWGEDELVTHDDAVPKDFHFEPRARVTLKLTPEKIERAARRSRRDFIYEHTLSELCIELVKFQEYVKANGLKVCVLFEGRDAAGKGGIISRIAAAMSPRVCKVVALTAPNERERTQWYFQRYVQHLPAAGEIVLFDRSWYNRAGVEKVMGFCTPEQYDQFVNDVPLFERMLVENGKILLVKYWLDVSDHEQELRFQGRLHRSWKRWKLSPMDLFARSKWTEYAVARDEMLRLTSQECAPWWVIPSDDKKARIAKTADRGRLARLNCISDLLSRVQYTEIPQEHLSLPSRDSLVPETQRAYKHPPAHEWNIVPQIYTKNDLVLHDIVGYESFDEDDDLYESRHASDD